jgi:acetyltransferase
MVNFHERLSERTVYQRYFHHMKLEQRISHERLARICFVDYDRQMVMVAERTNPETGQRDIVGVARLVKMLNPGEAEFAILVADDFQNKGLGSELTRTVMQIAREEKLTKMTAEVLADNANMVSVCRRMGFHLDLQMEDATMRAEMNL